MKEDNATMLKIAQNTLSAGVGLISAVIYGKQAYDGAKIRFGGPKLPPKA